MCLGNLAVHTGVSWRARSVCEASTDFAVSLDEFSHAYGLLLLVQGVSNLVGPPFAGYLFDVTRQWYLGSVAASDIRPFRE